MTSKLTIVLVSVFCSAFFPSGVALAQVSRQYTGCLKNGKITNVAIGEQPLAPCDSTETEVSWNQTGPQGPQGVPGPAGPQGPSGMSGYEVIRQNIQVSPFPENSLKDITLTCPEGKRVLGGGSGNNVWTNIAAGVMILPVQSMPSPNSSTFNTSETSWTVSFANFGISIDVNLAVYIICANVN